MEIRTVLCPVDFSELSERELGLAVEVCEAFGARLVLHYNVGATPPGFTKSWEWAQAHQPQERPGAAAERRLSEILDTLPEAVRGEAVVTHGPLEHGLLALVEELPADLVVLGCHGWSSDDHASLSERLLARCSCPVLTIQEGRCETDSLHLTDDDDEPAVIVAATDFSQSGDRAVGQALALAAVFPVELHLLHVLEGRKLTAAPLSHSPGPLAGPRDQVEAARHRLEELVPESLRQRVTCHVESGRPADAIVDFARRFEPELIVMGRHAPSFLRRLFTRDTSRELLHRACCAVWFVPPRARAA